MANATCLGFEERSMVTNAIDKNGQEISGSLTEIPSEEFVVEEQEVSAHVGILLHLSISWA